MAEFRVGQGYDMHRLATGRDLIIGGVKIPFEKGLDGHSDADVLIHAICDALLGAAGLPDIGQQFPNSDEKFRGADSLSFLTLVVKKLTEAGYSKIINIDATIVAEFPPMNPHIAKMRANLAAVLNIAGNRIGLKATTNEKTGFVGRGEGIAALAVCLIASDD